MLIRHSLIYILAKLVPGVLGMLTTALLTRLLDPTQYGLYGLALVVMSFGSTMVFDWLGVSFMRFYQRRRGDPIVVNTLVQMFLALVAGSAVLTGIAGLCGLFSGREAPMVAIGIVLMWAWSWFELSGRFEIANFRPARYFLMNIGRGVFSLAGAASAAWLTHSPLWTGIGTALGTALGGLFGGFSSWRLGRRNFDPVLAREVLAFGLPMAASMTLASLVNTGTRTLVETLGSAEALGLYTAAFMLVQNTISLVAAGIASAGYSLAVKAVESGDDAAAHRQLLGNSTLLLATLAPAAVGMALTAHGIAATMVGPRFVASVAQLTPWMAAAGFFANFRAHHLDHAFQLGKRPGIQVTVTAVAAAIALGLSVLLIPRLGPVGAAIAATVAMAVSCVYAFFAGHAAYKMPFPSRNALRVAAACVVMAVLVLAVPGGSMPAFLMQIVLGGAGYVTMAVALNLMELRDSLMKRARHTST